MQKKFLLLLMAVSFTMTALQAQTIQYGALLLGSKEAPPNASPGIGGAKVTIDATAKTMRVECAFNGLTGNVTNSHIHAATAVALTGTAGVATTTPTFTGFPSGVTAGSYDNTFDMTLSTSYNASYITANGGTTATAFAALQLALASGKAYFNIHSSTFGGGEIRGFLVPCATTSTTNIAVCPSELPYTWNGMTLNGAGTLVKVFPNGNAVTCDSTATLNLTVKDNTSSADTVSVCNRYTWNGTEYLVSGDYMYHTTNAAGCDSMAELHLTILSVTSTTSKTDVTGCNGTATGSITVTPTYGVLPFAYRLGTSGAYGPSNIFNSLRAGSYRVSILDANGCAGVSDQVTIMQPAAVTGTAAIVNASCNSTYTGSITVTPTTGTGPYTYRFGTSGLYGGSNVFSSLRAGTYRIYIKDANGCIGSISATVTQPTKAVLSFTKTDLTCFAANDGTISLSGSGGTGPYTFRLGTSGSYSTTSTFTNLKPGSYRAYIKDANGCLGGSLAIIIEQSINPCNPDKQIAFSKATINNSTNQLELSLSPNPSPNQFALVAKGHSLTESVWVRVMDINGKNIYQTKIKAEQTLRFGSEFAPGIYMVEVRQGNEVKMMKVVKAR
jgi:hypothetical protein